MNEISQRKIEIIRKWYKHTKMTTKHNTVKKYKLSTTSEDGIHNLNVFIPMWRESMDDAVDYTYERMITVVKDLIDEIEQQAQ